MAERYGVRKGLLEIIKTLFIYIIIYFFVVIDNMRKEIVIIEVGIINRDSFNKIEMQKYNLLASELKRIYRYNVNIVPIIFSWDGLITRYFKKYTESIELDDNIIDSI